jgi:DNA-binding PadR family transcriptional regulator
VAKLANISYVTVTVWWKKWIRAGIAEATSAKGGQRAKRIFSLTDFGFEIPELEPKEKAKPIEETTQP